MVIMATNSTQANCFGEELCTAKQFLLPSLLSLALAMAK
jgi:hypothetical protein